MRLNDVVRLATGLACAAAFVTAQAQSVKINGREIPQSRIDAAVKLRVAQGQPDSPQLRETVREVLINQEIISQEAVRKGLDKNSEVAAAIDLNRKEILVNAYLNDYLKANPLTDDVMRKEFERIKPQIPTREYKSHHILVDAEAEAKEIIAQIKQGGNFEKIAAEKSKDGGTKGRGGDLDWAPAATYVKPFADALVKLKKGQMTETPVQTNHGWHVIRLDDERPTKVPSFDEAKPQLQQLMRNQMVQKAVADLRAKAKVE